MLVARFFELSRLDAASKSAIAPPFHTNKESLFPLLIRIDTLLEMVVNAQIPFRSGPGQNNPVLKTVVNIIGINRHLKQDWSASAVVFVLSPLSSFWHAKKTNEITTRI